MPPTFPYGQKSPEQIRHRATAIGGFLVQQGAKAIVVACNTATAAAIDVLRARWPIPVVGVEPAIKPAVAATRSGVVGVLATPATLASERYRSLMERFAGDIRIEPLLIELWAPHARLRHLPEFQSNAGRDFNATP